MAQQVVMERSSNVRWSVIGWGLGQLRVCLLVALLQLVLAQGLGHPTARAWLW